APFAVAAYAGVARSLLLAHKEDGVVALRRPLGEALARALAAAAAGTAGPVQVVAVPSSRAARRRRGDDVVAALVREGVRVARAGGCPVHALPALRHVRRVADSAGLGAGARAANLAAAFGLRRGADRLVPGAAVVLADDLITTGATL